MFWFQDKPEEEITEFVTTSLEEDESVIICAIVGTKTCAVKTYIVGMIRNINKAGYTARQPRTVGQGP